MRLPRPSRPPSIRRHVLLPRPLAAPFSAVDAPCLLFEGRAALWLGGRYGKQMMAEWMKQTPDWKTDIHKKGLRWSESWDVDSDAAFAALATYMSTPPAVVACRNTTVWPKPL